MGTAGPVAGLEAEPEWWETWEAEAERRLPPHAYAYYASGAGRDVTRDEGLRDWDALRLLPHMLRRVSGVATRTTVLGTEVATPVLVAPMAGQEYAHPDGEQEMAKGAAGAGSLLGVTTWTASRFENIAASGAPWWYQVYVMRDRGLTAELVRRAVDHGARALLFTVDVPVLGRRGDNHRAADLDPLVRLVNLDGRQEFPREAAQMEPDLTPDLIGWLHEISGLPVLVKGVLRADDAKVVVDHGGAGVVVSTHGGRQLDRSVTSASALPRVVEALAGTGVEVYADSGVRRGEHIAAALALGARAVFVGRPALWGLATEGAAGVQEAVDRLTAELAHTMTLLGVETPAALTPDLVA
ncbi:alpha-hydroxy acid oxidase [Streptomyces sp. NPDC000941]